MTVLRFGSAAKKIDPELGCRLQGHINRNKPATALMDSLFAQAFAFELGENRLLIVACDLFEFDHRFIDQQKAAIRESLCLPQSNCLICASHIHTGPPTIDLGALKADRKYLLGLKRSITDLSRQAFQNLEEVSLRVAGAEVAMIGVNRRRKTQAGVRMAPNPEGPVDRDCLVVRIDRADGTPVAAILNHGAHPTTIGVHINQISADYPGRARRYLEKSVGSGFTAMYIQGACGDVNPAVFDEDGNFKEGEEKDIDDLGRRLGTRAVQLLNRGSSVEVSSLVAQGKRIRFPFEPIPETIDLERELSRYVELSGRPTKEKNHELLEESWEYKHINREALYGEMAVWARSMIAKANRKGIPRSVQGEIQAFAFGKDLVLLGFPGELFSEIGMNIKSRSPFRHTLVCGYSNGTVGYVPTRSAMIEGGYEIDDSYKLYGHPARFRHDIEELIYAEVDALLGKLYSLV